MATPSRQTKDEAKLWQQYIKEPDGPHTLRQNASETRYYPELSHLAPRAPSPRESSGALFPKNEEEIEADAIRADQGALLRGFTIAELDSMGCWALEDAKPNNLTCPIHPLYERQNWIQNKKIRIGNGYSGNWDARNNIVWEAIEPALRLASTFLLNGHLWPWLNGLLCGPWEKIEGKDLMPQPKRNDELVSKSEHKYGGWQFQDHQEENDKVTREKNNKIIEFVIERITCNFEFLPYPAFGHTLNIAHGGASRISMGLLPSLPLLNKKLTASERLVQEAFFATTLVHESMHALTHAVRNVREDIPNLVPRKVENPYLKTYQEDEEERSTEPEPFYGGEANTEIGRSWEKVTFGGFTDTVRATNDPRLPILVHVIIDWPTFINFPPFRKADMFLLQERHRHPERFGPDSRCSMFPMPTKYSEWIGQQRFWDVYAAVRGREALRVPRICGRQTTPDGSVTVIYGREAKHWVPEAELSKTRSLPPLSSNTQGASKWLYESNRLTRQHAIDSILHNQRNRERERDKYQRWFRTRKNMDDAIEAYQKGRINDAKKLLDTIGETDSYKYNLLRDVFYYSLYSRSSDEETRERAREFGKDAKKRFLAWIKAEASWITPQKLSEFLNEPNKLDPLYHRIADILFVSEHLDSKKVNTLKQDPSCLKQWREEIEGAVREMDRKEGGLRNLVRNFTRKQAPPVFDLQK